MLCLILHLVAVDLYLTDNLPCCYPVARDLVERRIEIFTKFYACVCREKLLRDIIKLA